MTSNGKASDQPLDGRSLCPGHSEGTCRACEITVKWHGTGCYFDCSQWGFHSCPCIYHTQCAIERLRNAGREGDPHWDYLLRQLDKAYAHAHKREEILLAVQKRKLHEQNKANAQSQLGPREFTLTYSPQWGWDDDEAQETMKSAIERLTRYYKHEIIEFHAIGEFGSDGRSHVHGWYHLVGGRKITDKNFKRAYPRWNPKRKLGKGFEGGHHATIARVSDFAGYTEKHLEEAWLKTDITNAVQSASSDTPEGVLEGSRVYEETHGSSCRSPDEASDEDSDQGDC